MKNNKANQGQTSENTENKEVSTTPTKETDQQTEGNNGEKTENKEQTEGNQDNTEVKKPENTTKTKETLKSFTIKNVKKEDQDFIKSFAKNGKTVPEAFAEVIRLAKRDPEIKEIIKEIEKQVEVEKLVEIEKKLSPGQFIVDLNEDTINNIRKCRPFIAKKTDYMDYERGNDQAFINALVNRCVNKLLKYDFDNILK